MNKNILDIKNLTKEYKSFDIIENRVFKALSCVNFSIGYEETLGIVGESGCGKSTLGKIIVGLEPPTKGEIFYKGNNIKILDKKSYKIYRKEVQMIFQNISASLNPRKKILDILRTPMLINKIESTRTVDKKIDTLLDKVGLQKNIISRWSIELSGGQQQRVGIARSLSMEPKILVADEPTSALDVSVQAQIIKLLKKLNDEFGLSMLFISHDLAVVKNISDRVIVLYLGEIVEEAKTEELFKFPRHPYTKLLFSSIPTTNPNKKIEGLGDKIELNKSELLNKGCVFYNRCFLRKEICLNNKPELIKITNTHYIKCHMH